MYPKNNCQRILAVAHLTVSCAQARRGLQPTCIPSGWACAPPHLINCWACATPFLLTELSAKNYFLQVCHQNKFLLAHSMFFLNWGVNRNLPFGTSLKKRYLCSDTIHITFYTNITQAVYFLQIFYMNKITLVYKSTCSSTIFCRILQPKICKIKNSFFHFLE